MKEDKGFFEQISFETVIYTHLGRISQLSTKVFSDDNSEGQQRSAYNYWASVKTLQAFISPYLDTETEERIAWLERREDFVKDNGHLAEGDGYYYSVVTYNLTNEILKILMSKLDEIGLLSLPVLSLSQSPQPEEEQDE